MNRDVWLAIWGVVIGAIVALVVVPLLILWMFP